MEYINSSNLSNNIVWNDKYCPKKIEDIIGNDKLIYDIINWLKLFDENKKKFFDKKKTKKSTKKTTKKPTKQKTKNYKKNLFFE